MFSSCHDPNLLNMIIIVTKSSWASLRHNGASCACVIWFNFKCLYVWICAYEGSSKYSMQIGLQKFYLNTRFQMLNLKYFCRILWPLNRATKFLETWKTAVLFFLLWPICKSFSNDSCWKIFLVILSSSKKSFVNFWAR